MKKKLPKVLMLGWEFPPLINGGLGIACHDLSVAMSEYADISMIIPKSDPDFVMNNMELIGLNHLAPEIMEGMAGWKDRYQELGSTDYVPANLNPYYNETIRSAVQNINEQVLNEQTRKTGKGPANQFGIHSLYDGDVSEKVYRFAQLATGLAMKKEFDLIHAHDWMTMMAGMEIKEKTGKPLVLHIHSLEIDRSGEESRGWVYQLEKRGMEAADVIIPVSNYTANIIKKYYGVDEQKIAPVHNGIRPVNPYRSLRKLKEKTVLFIGRITRQKGPELFLDIASKVLSKNKDVRFIMAGTGDSFRNVLEQSAYQNIGNRFHFTGFLDLPKVRQLLSIADVYCMPSVSEPFGLSAVEAAQFNVPCVISKQSGVAEVMSGALKFDFWDTRKAAGYILNLLHDPVLNNTIVGDANQNLQHISWKFSAKKVMEIYGRKKAYLN